MKALVTGGAGFIGSNVVNLLLEEGHQVTVLDNLSSGYIENIQQVINEKRVEFIEADICDEAAVMEACRNKDIVFHLAANVGRQKSLDDPIQDSKTNVLGTIQILEGMRKNNIPRIIYSSSAAIFGELLTPTIDEDHPQNADSPYGVSKLAAEKMILSYCHIYGITGICLRYFNIYGINQRFDMYGNVIPIFADAIYSDRAVTIYGDGSQTRDFLNVIDVARANVLAAKSATGTAVYNLGSGTSITIQRLAEMMYAIAGKETKIHYAPERLADVKHCKANTMKIDQQLLFKAIVGLDTGLGAYMDWYQRNFVEG